MNMPKNTNPIPELQTPMASLQSFSLRRRAREAFFPTDWFGLLVLALAFLRIVLWLANLWHTMPHAGMDVYAIFRFFGGDTQYFDIMQSVSRLNPGETSVLEEQGFGFRSFPLQGVLIHAAWFRALGPAGFFVADFFTIWIYLACGIFMWRCLGLTQNVARSVTVLTLATHWWAASAIRGTATLNFWAERIPRPSGTLPQFLIALGLLAVMLVSVTYRRKVGVWVALGICISLLVQGDLHSGIAVSLITGALMIWLWTRPQQGGLSRGQWLRRLAALAGAVLVILIPFFTARLLEHPDAPARLGRIPISRWRPFLDRTLLPYAVAGVVLTAGIAFVYRWLTRDRHDAQTVATRQIATAMPVAVFISYFALPISIITLGQGAQLFHFRDTTRYLVSFFLAFGLGLLVQTIAERWLAAAPATRRLAVYRSAKIAVLAITLAGMVYTFGLGTVPDNIRPNESNEPGKRQAFLEMTQVVRPLRAAGLDVIATWDPMVYPWWVDMLEGHSYMPEIFATTLPDRVIEKRLAQYCKLLGMNADQFDTFTRSFETQFDFLGECKYNATCTYALAPLSDYEPAEQARILASPRDATYNYTIPLSERARLRRLFESVSTADADLYRLDLIVLRAKEWETGLKPPSDRFHQVYANPYYQVWVRNAAPAR
ncbi:MAG: hypothetical protein WCI73_05080 [Phycisphaerae bacterium]